ncbi:Uncharacterized protein TCM_021963 [Theobroma cacao]|uniref:Uncharacterized protein n=1 Tax=Theobroma cacao TaxID=3641 RepID=A0A061ERU1_THECC|nr:Uncharacterized protein TCM_021963 [Theobroma cacao]
MGDDQQSVANQESGWFSIFQGILLQPFPSPQQVPPFAYMEGKEELIPNARQTKATGDNIPDSLIRAKSYKANREIVTEASNSYVMTINSKGLLQETNMDTPKALWRVRLGSAFRTVLACTIVGCTTLYGPEPVRRFLTFPAFSYVTTILIVSDTTLGDALRGCWHVLYASIQVLLPSMLSLWLIGPARFSHGLAAMAVALSSFAIALPDSTHLMAKRIAFGQTLIVYVDAVIQGAETGVLMHPIHVASNSALGAWLLFWQCCFHTLTYPTSRQVAN